MLRVLLKVKFRVKLSPCTQTQLNQLRQRNSWPYRTEEREDYHTTSSGEMKLPFTFLDMVAENGGYTDVTVQYVAIMSNQTLYLLQMVMDIALACANSASCFLMSSLIDFLAQLNRAAMGQ